MENETKKKQFRIMKLEERIAPSACNGVESSLGLGDSPGGGLQNAFNTSNTNAQLFSAFLHQADACVQHG